MTLAVFGALVAAGVAGSALVDRFVDDAERAMLGHRTREGGLVLGSTITNLQIPLAAAVTVAEGTDHDPDAFGAVLTRLAGPEGPFRAATLTTAGADPVAVGQPRFSADDPGLISLSALARTRPSSLTAALLGNGADRHLVMAVAGSGGAGAELVHAEISLPADPPPTPRGERAFQDLEFALYYGDEEEPGALLLRSTATGDLADPRASTFVPLGNQRLLLVTTPRDTMLGGLQHLLPEILLGAAVLIALGAAVLVENLVRRRNSVLERNAELDRRVEARTAELSATNQELETFAYSVSHDLRSPLRAIDGFSLAVLQSSGESLGEQARSDLMRVRHASQRMGEMIDDLLMLSSVGHDPLRVEDVDLSRDVRDLLDRLHDAEPHRHTETTVAPELHTRGDRRLLDLALQNLLANAWKYSGKEPEACIEFGSATIDGTSTYFVRDNGVGFDPSYAEMLFRPFQRLHGPEEFEGSGIGLATVARVIDRHGGRIWAESAPGAGATFYFTCEPDEVMA